MTDKKFQFKDIDQEGEETLEVLTLAPRFNKWMFDTIKKYSKGHVLEIGSGIGNLSEQYLKNGYSISLSDLRDSYISKLKKKFSGENGVKEVLNMDVVDSDFDNKFKSSLGKYNTVVALNVVEHIENDKLAIENIYKLLAKDGNAIILVPAHQSLYNRLDEELFHYRRYNLKRLRSLFDTEKYELEDSFYFNLAGILGWFISGKLQRNKTLPAYQIKVYNFLVPVFKLIDFVTLSRIGLSAICIARKK